MTAIGGMQMGEGSEEPESARRVLVVDDSSVIRDLISVNLRLEGFEVTTAVDGESALELVAEVRPHVVTLDVMMPRLNGFQTVRRLREDPQTAHIPIVIVTGRAQAGDIARGQALGVEAYLTKPFEPAELVEVISRLARSGNTSAPGQNGAADTLDR